MGLVFHDEKESIWRKVNATKYNSKSSVFNGVGLAKRQRPYVSSLVACILKGKPRFFGLKGCLRSFGSFGLKETRDFSRAMSLAGRFSGSFHSFCFYFV